MRRLPIITDLRHTPEMAAWAAKRIPHMGDFGPCWAVGVHRGGTLAAVVIYSMWSRATGTVMLSCAADTPRWASRPVVAEILRFAFDGALGAPVRKVWMATPADNARAIRFAAGVGFKQEAVLREHFGPKRHATVLSMMEREFRRRHARPAAREEEATGGEVG